MIDRRTVLTAGLAVVASALTPWNAAAQSASRARLWQDGDPGQRLFLRGRVLTKAGRPVAGATVQVRQADGAGSYHGDRYQAALVTGEDGAFALNTALPGQYYGEKHIHVLVIHPDHPPLPTQILFRGDPNLDESFVDGHVVILEEVRRDGETVLVGGVEFVLDPAGQ